MTPQEMIFRHHIAMFKSAKAYGNNDAEALSIVSASVANSDPMIFADQLQKKHHIPTKVAQVWGRTASGDVNHEIQTTMYRLMPNEYSTISSAMTEILLTHPKDADFFKPLQLLKSSILTDSTALKERYYQYRFFKAIFSCVGKSIDLRFWSADNDLQTNIKRAGLSGNKLLKLLIDATDKLMMKNNALNDIWDVKYLANQFTFDETFNALLTTFTDLTHDRIEAGNTLQDLYGFWISLVHKKSSLPNKAEWKDYEPSVAIKVLFWVVQNKRWFSDQTLVYDARVKGKVSINHHEAITALCGRNVKVPNISIKDHPKDILFDLINELAHQKVKKLLDERKKISYPKALPAFSKLPKSWEHISTNIRSIVEGQTMNHCCGGDNYVNECSKGKSIFFHIETDEPYGLTLQLEVGKPDVVINHYRGATINSFRFEGSDNFYRIAQVKGRFNRNPTEEEKKMYRYELMRISDISWFETKHGFNRFSTMTDVGYSLVNVKDRNAGQLFADAVLAGTLNRFHSPDEILDLHLVWEERILNNDIIRLGGKSGKYSSQIHSDGPVKEGLRYAKLMAEEYEDFDTDRDFLTLAEANERIPDGLRDPMVDHVIDPGEHIRLHRENLQIDWNLGAVVDVDAPRMFGEVAYPTGIHHETAAVSEEISEIMTKGAREFEEAHLNKPKANFTLEHPWLGTAGFRESLHDIRIDLDAAKEHLFGEMSEELTSIQNTAIQLRRIAEAQALTDRLNSLRGWELGSQYPSFAGMFSNEKGTPLYSANNRIYTREKKSSGYLDRLMRTITSPNIDRLKPTKNTDVFSNYLNVNIDIGDSGKRVPLQITFTTI